MNIEKANNKLKKINININSLDDIIKLGYKFKKKQKKSKFDNKNKLYLFDNEYYSIDPLKIIKVCFSVF